MHGLESASGAPWCLQQDISYLKLKFEKSLLETYRLCMGASGPNSGNHHEGGISRPDRKLQNETRRRSEAAVSTEGPRKGHYGC